MESLLQSFERPVKSFPAWTEEVKFGVIDTWKTKAEVRATETAARPAAAFIRGLLTDDTHKRACRAAAQIPDKDERKRAKDEQKAQLKFWAISGYYVATDAPRTTYTQLDFDHFKSDADVKRAKEILIDLQCALIVSTSASGRGVFAVIDTGAIYDKETLKERCLDPVETIIKAQGIEAEYGELGDAGVLDAGHGRVEAYDPDLYVSPDHVIFDARAIKIRALRAEREAQERADKLAHTGYHSHPIHLIANALRNNAPTGSIATAAALAFAAANLDVYSKCANSNRYPARALIIVLSHMGAGKTTMMDAITTARRETGGNCIIIKPKSEAALEAALVRCGTREETDGDGKKHRVPLDRHETPKACICTIDEAGKFLQSVHKNEKCGDMDSAFCQAFDGHFTPSLTKGSMPENDDLFAPLPTNATIFMTATPPQWIQYAATENENNGALRRRLIFFDDTKEIELGGDAPTLRELRAAKPDTSTNGFMLSHYAEQLASIAKGAEFAVTDGALDATGAATQALKDAGIPQEAWETLIINYGTLCAAARCALTDCQRYEVTPLDMQAVADILRASLCKTRGIIAERVEAQSLKRHKSDEEVWLDIREYVGNGKRRSHLKKWLGNRPPIYERTYLSMKSRGEFIEVASGGKSEKSIRLATDEERAAFAERHEEAAKRAKMSVFDGTATDYASASEDEKIRKLEKYRKGHETDNPIIDGQRDNSLRSLATKLHDAGMDDSTARNWFFALCDTLGAEFANARAKERLWRPIKAA